MLANLTLRLVGQEDTHAWKFFTSTSSSAAAQSASLPAGLIYLLTCEDKFSEYCKTLREVPGSLRTGISLAMVSPPPDVVDVFESKCCIQ